MSLRRRLKRDVPRAGPFPPGWDVPAAFNFTRDVVEAYATDPLRSALTFVDTEGIVDRRTYREVAGDAARWAHLLRTRLDRGDRVMVVMGKVPSWPCAMLGAIKGGLVAVPCPSMLRARDLAFRVRDSGARLVIADRECEPEIEEMRNQIGDIVAVLYLDEALAELGRYRPAAPTEETTAGETALILYTSGTTKEPRGVVHTHAYTWAQRMQAGEWLDCRERDVVWCTAGTGWAKAIWNVLLGPWSHGAEVVLHESAFDPEERLSLIQRLGVSVLCQAPTEYRMLAKVDTLATAYLPKLRHAVSAGEPLNPEVIATFQDALGITVHDGYGQTENSLLVANLPGAPIRPGSMGLPTEGHDVAVIDAAGNVCPPGVEGDIALIGRPPTLFRGYWNDPDATEGAFRDGWYITGDRATRDEQGYMWFVGRTDDVILSAAYRIGPFEVESALLEHPAVAESAVVGVPDAERGQIVKAFVVLRPGHEPGSDLAIELQDHVKAITAPYKYPRAISFVDELPKTSSGKIRRGELREVGSAAEEFVPAAVVVPLRAVPDPAAADETAGAEGQAAEAARREEAMQARARAAAEVERLRVEAEAAARRAAEEAERFRVEAEEAARVRAVAEAQARRETEEAERTRAEEEEQARREAEVEVGQARAEAQAAAQREAEEHARVESERAERARAEAEAAAAAEQARREAEEAERIRAEAEAAAAEQARREAEQAERARVEAEAAAAAEQARREAEEAERARAEAEAAAADQARREAEAAEERARAEAEAAAADQARREAEEAERARAEAEAAAEEAARLEAEEAERARAEAEAAAADQARREAEEAERARAEAEAAAEEAARLEAEEAERARAEAEAAAADQARREAEEAERVRAEAEAEEVAALAARQAEEAARREAEEAAALAAGQAEIEGEGWRDVRRRKREDEGRRKAEAEEAKRRAKEEAEQRQRDEAAAREEARRRAIEEKEAAKQRVIDEKRRAEEEKIAAKQRAEDEKRREADEKLAAKQFAEDEKHRAKEAEEQRKRDEIAAREEARRRAEAEKEAAKHAEDARRRKRDWGKRRGLGRLLPGDEPDDDYGPGDDDDAAAPIPDIVERLQKYSGTLDALTEEPPLEEPQRIDGGVRVEADHRAEVEPPREPTDDDLDADHVDERRSAH